MTATTHTIDRAGWPPGPWDNEPDYLSWTDETTGLPCLIVRNRVGALCGYAAVEPGPWHGVGYGERLPSCDCQDDYCYEHTPGGATDVHGGLTYANECASLICHVPEPGKPDDVWWFGFDCAHWMDQSPGLMSFGLASPDETYRTVDYVRSQVASLAAQLLVVAS